MHMGAAGSGMTQDSKFDYVYLGICFVLYKKNRTM